MSNVVVTGMGFVTSIGSDSKTVLDSLQSQRHGIEIFVPPLGQEKCPVSLIGTIKNFDTSSTDPEDWSFPGCYSLKRDILRGLSPHGLYAICAVQQAKKNRPGHYVLATLKIQTKNI